MNRTSFPAGALLYAFADQLIEADDWKSKGVKLPGQDRKVKATPLAAHVFAFAFWRLAEDRIVALRHERRKRLGLISTERVTAQLIGPADPRPAGTEQMLLAHLAGAEASIEDVVYRALGQDYPDPARVVVGLAARDGVAAGLFDEVASSRGAVGRLVFGGTEIQPNEAAMPDGKAQFADLLLRWQAFRAADPVLAEQLVAKCAKGISRRTEASDSD